MNVLNIQDKLDTHESEKTIPNFTISDGSLEKPLPVPIKISKPTVIKELIDVSEEQDESIVDPLSNPYRESLN